MKIGVNFSPLQDLVHQMRARRSKWSLAPYVPPPVRELRRKLSTGIEAQIAEVKPGPGRLLTFKGEQVLLYIKETRQSKYILQNFPEDARRFHIYECATIGQMRRSNRFERYVVTTRQGGLFAVNDLKGDEIEARLRVCKNCLWGINWKDYSSNWDAQKQNELWVQFNLRDFFQTYETFFRTLPKHSDQTSPRGGYVSGWSHKSDSVKKKRNWRCEECHVKLSAPNHRHLLHVHHKNGVTWDNRSENLAVLCMVCHAEQPYHGRIKPTDGERRVIQILRPGPQTI